MHFLVRCSYLDFLLSISNFHTDLQTGDLTFIFISSFVFCLDFWLNIQDFIFGLGMPIFSVHHDDISTINFHTDFQSGNVNLDLFRFDFCHFLAGLSNFHFWAWCVNFPYLPCNFNFKLSHSPSNRRFNYHLYFELQFRFDCRLNIQDFISGLGMSIVAIHPDIPSLNFHTDFQLEKVDLDIFCFGFWLDIQDFIFGLSMSIFPILHEISTLNLHLWPLSICFLARHSWFQFWAWYVNSLYSPWNFIFGLRGWSLNSGVRFGLKGCGGFRWV